MSTPTEIFKNILSSDNSLRKSAEASLQQTKTLPFESALSFYMEGITSEDSKISQLSALMFKKTLLDDNDYLKTQVSTEKAENLVNQVFYPLVNDKREWKFLERIGENIVKLYTICDLNKSFSQIVALFNSQNPEIRRFSIFLLEGIIDLSLIKEELIQVSVNDFNSLFTKGLIDENSLVRISTLKATTALLSSISNKSLILQFASLTKEVINSLVYCLQNDIEESKLKSKSCLEALNLLVEIHPKIFKNDIDSLLIVIIEILKTTSFDYSIRQSAFQIVLSLSKGVPAFLRKSLTFKSDFIPILMSLLKDLDNLNDIQAWSRLSDDNDHDREELFYAAREGIEVLATDLGSKFLDFINPFISKMLTSSDWTEVHGGLISVGWLSDIYHKQFKADLKNLLHYVSAGLDHTHPRVRYAALNCLGMLSSSNKPYLQKTYHSNVLPALAKVISNENENIRVRIETILCLSSFLKGFVDEEESVEVDDYSDEIKPYSKELLSLLAKTFTFSLTIQNFKLQEACLSCISLIATILGQEFSVFYNEIMPFLKELLLNLISSSDSNGNPNKKQLTAECINTISFICSSLNENPTLYKPDFIYFCDLFQKLLLTLKEEDPEVISIFKGYSHLSTSMKEEFYPYLERLFPLLSKYITADIDLKIEDVDLEKVTDHKENDDEKSSPGLILQTGGVNKKLSLKTYVLQNKIMAFEVLKDICLNMNSAFNPYISSFISLITPLIPTIYSRKIRKLAIRSFEAIVYSCKTPEDQRQVFDLLLEKFLDKIKNDVKIGMIRDIKHALKVFIHIFSEVKQGNVIKESSILSIYTILTDVISFVETKKHSVTESIKNEDAYDENDKEGFDCDIEVLNEINRRVMELSGVLFKLYKEPLSDVVFNGLTGKFVNIFKNSISTTRNEQEILYSLCFMNDLLSYSKKSIFTSHYQLFIEYSSAYLLYVTSNNQVNNTENYYSILQNIVFGYGVIALRSSKDEYLSVGKTITDTISTVLTMKRSENNEECFENAVSALGKIVYCQTDVNEEGILLAGRFLDLLPLKADLDESDESIRLLCENYLNGNGIICNDGYGLKIKDVLGKVNKMNIEEEFLSEETKRLVDLVRQRLG